MPDDVPPGAIVVDVYAVLKAYAVTCQARGHAVKKLLLAGDRGHKDVLQDLREAAQAVQRAIEMAEQDKSAEQGIVEAKP